MQEVQNNIENQQPRHDREELPSAADVMSAMVRAAKGLRIYLPNNPVLIKFLDEGNEKMSLHLQRFGGFQLEVDRFALWYKGEELYHNPDPKESIAFRLHSDGIRAVLFAPGVQRQEMTSFLEIIGFEGQSPQDDDVVTQLWERSLPHISHLLEEDFIEVDQEDEHPPLPQQEAITAIFAKLRENPPLPPRMIPRHLLMLTGEEAKWLRKIMQAEAVRNPLDDVINIVSAVLSGVNEPGIFREFIDIMTKLASEMFLAGELGDALRLVRFLDQIRKGGGLSSDQQQQVSAALAGLLSEKTVQVLQETLDARDSVSYDDLRELLHILGLPSLNGICQLLGRVEKLKIRKLIIEVLVALAKDDPKVLAPYLCDPRWYLVRNVVLVLSLLGSPVALEMIVGLISHKEMRIRREVLGFLERSSDPKAKTYILKFFRDDSSALRVRAVQILARERHPFALKLIVAVTTTEEFRSRELAEKKAVYQAIGELGNENTIPLFRDMLLKPTWFKKGVDKESAICATAGLMKMKSPAALQLLEEARKQRNVEIRGIVEQAIMAITAGKGRAQARLVEV